MVIFIKFHLRFVIAIECNNGKTLNTYFSVFVFITHRRLHNLGDQTFIEIIQ